MNITLETACSISEAANATLYIDYSGRGMYGKKCVGFVVRNQSAVLSLGAALAQAANDAGESPSMADAEFDSLGMNQIVYFPNVQVVG